MFVDKPIVILIEVKKIKKDTHDEKSQTYFKNYFIHFNNRQNSRELGIVCKLTHFKEYLSFFVKMEYNNRIRISNIYVS